MGVSTTLAVFFHEIPHELGDMGILIKSGASKWQALGINSLSALGATIGAGVGCYLEQSPAFADHVLPITAGPSAHTKTHPKTDAQSWPVRLPHISSVRGSSATVAGGFIYIAMAEMMPQLHESPSLFHTFGIALGIFLMACVSLLE